MDQQKAAENLEIIRQLMERPIRFSTMSGLSGILAGAAAVAGAAVHLHIWNHYPAAMAVWLDAAIWAGVFLVALSGVLILTRLRERRAGMPWWSGVKARILWTILPPFAAGAGFAATLVGRWFLGGSLDSGAAFNQGYLIPPVWMLCYGLALWQLGEFSPREVRWLGGAFVAAGLASAGFLTFYPWLEMGLTFGLLHILYGVVVLVKYGG